MAEFIIKDSKKYVVLSIRQDTVQSAWTDYLATNPTNVSVEYAEGKTLNVAAFVLGNIRTEYIVAMAVTATDAEYHALRLHERDLASIMPVSITEGGTTTWSLSSQYIALNKGITGISDSGMREFSQFL